MATFDSTKLPLQDILGDIVKGKIQLPDFQRGWVWDDSHIRSLLVSVAKSFPVGAVMLLETGGETRFQLRGVEGVSPQPDPATAEQLILDGQQRLTTLTQVLALKGAVATRTDKGKPIERHYYWHIPTALDPDASLEDALIAVESDRKRRTNFGRDVDLDLSTTQLECEQMYFPCDQTMMSDEWEDALDSYATDPSQARVFRDFRAKVLSSFRKYQMPVIKLDKSTSKEAVCLVFEKVNTGGVPLNVFELVTATFAADNYNLRDDWYGSKQRQVESRQGRLLREAVLLHVEATDFLQTVCMLHTLALRKADLAAGKTGKQVTPISAKRASILDLELSDYLQWAGMAEAGFIRAAEFLHMEHVRDPRELPYRTQLTPLAAVLGIIEDRWLEPVIKDKLSRWYWCGVLGELYGGAVETRIANDVDDLLHWILHDGPEPRTVQDATFNPDRLDRLTSRLSAAYKGLSMLVLREDAADWFYKVKINELDQAKLALDIHHIFPQHWCETQRQPVPRSRYNSIINKTPISAKANRMIGGQAPSIYLQKIQQHQQVQIDDAAMNKLLESHQIPVKAIRLDDFDAFYAARKAALLALIETVMGKAVLGGGPLDEEEEDEALD